MTSPNPPFVYLFVDGVAERLPVAHRRFVRTANRLERLLVEKRRRLKIIPNGFGEKPALKLMFASAHPSR